MTVSLPSVASLSLKKTTATSSGSWQQLTSKISKQTQMHGLEAYDDESASEADENVASSSSSLYNNERKLKGRSDTSVEHGISSTSRQADQFSGSVIRKGPRHTMNAPLRSPPIPGTSNPGEAARSIPIASSSRGTSPSTSHASSDRKDDDLLRIRELLLPPPVAGLDGWGIPPAPDDDDCDSALIAKLAQFHELKRDPADPRHFNDSLMANRSFRNPHLYVQLVDFVDVDECATNFTTEVWDPTDVKQEWYAERIADQQKRREEKQAANQAAGKRSRIDFTAPSPSSRPASALTRNGGGVTGNKYISSATANSAYPNRQSRFAPYSSGSGANAPAKGRAGGRWG